MSGIATTGSRTRTSRFDMWRATVPLDIEDLEVLAAEASRQSLSLACLIGAMECQQPILWCEETNGATKA